MKIFSKNPPAKGSVYRLCCFYKISNRIFNCYVLVKPEIFIYLEMWCQWYIINKKILVVKVKVDRKNFTISRGVFGLSSLEF